MEIDEYRDYDKACGAFRESLKYLSLATTPSATSMKFTIENRISLVEKFIKARNIEKDDPQMMVSICEVPI